MVDFVTFVVGNYGYFISLTLTGLLLLTAFFLYRKSGNNGFLLIVIGEIISGIWGFTVLFFG